MTNKNDIAKIVTDYEIPPGSEYCIYIVLPNGTRGPKYGSSSVTSFVKGMLAPDKAVRSILKSASDKKPRCSLIVCEDGINHHVCNVMAATSAFIAEAMGVTVSEEGCYCIPKSIYMENLIDKDLDLVDVIADLCIEPVFETTPISASDFSVSFLAGPDEPDIEYIGNIPDPVMEVIGEMDVQDSVLRSYFDVLGVEDRFDLPDHFDVVEAMSFGRTKLAAPYLAWGARVSDPYWPLISDFVLADTYVQLPGYKPYADLIKEIEDLRMIWQHSQETHHIGIRIGRYKKNPVPSPEEIKTAMEKIADLLGIDTAIAAYYSGVPASDIVA